MFDWLLILIILGICLISYDMILDMENTEELSNTMLYFQYPNKGYKFSWKLIWLLIIYRISQASFILLLTWNIIINLAEAIKHL